jgi:hypothetical protein
VKPRRLDIRVLDLVVQTRWCTAFWTVGPPSPLRVLQRWIQRWQNSMSSHIPRHTWSTELHIRTIPWIIDNLWLVTRENYSKRTKVDWRGNFHVSIKCLRTTSSVVFWMMFSMQQYFCLKAFIFCRLNRYCTLSFVCFHFFPYPKNVLPWIVPFINYNSPFASQMLFCRSRSLMNPVVLYIIWQCNMSIEHNLMPYVCHAGLQGIHSQDR